MENTSNPVGKFDENNVELVDLPVLFGSHGWQFSTINSSDNKFCEIPHQLNTVGGDVQGLSKSVIWSTDGGKFAANPRVYFTKAVTPLDRAYTFQKFLNFFENLVEVDMGDMDLAISTVGVKDVYRSCKVTIAPKGTGYLLTFYYMDAYGELSESERKLEFHLNENFLLQGISTNGFESIANNVSSRLAMFTTSNPQDPDTLYTKLQYAISPVLLAWKAIDRQLGTNSCYLEIVYGGTHFVMDGATVLQKDTILPHSSAVFKDPGTPYTTYTGATVISPETGFSIELDPSFYGKTAVCVAV